MTSTKEARDNLLGRTLALAAAVTPSVTVCPGNEALAALVDGRLTDTERDSILGHLAACITCRQLHELTVQLIEHEERGGKRNWMMLAGSIAAILVAVSSVTLVNRQEKQKSALHTLESYPGTVGRSSPSLSVALMPASPAIQVKERSAVAAAVTLAMRLPTEVALSPMPGNRDLGFASQVDSRRDALMLGRNLFYFETVLARKDRSNAIVTISEIRRLVQRLDSQATTATSLRMLEKKLSGTLPLKDVQGRVGELIEPSLHREELHYLMLGEWLQGAQLAAEAGQADYFTAEYFVSTAVSLSKVDLPQQLKDEVTTVSDLARHVPLQATDFRQIERITDKIMGD
jgi:hypothetical protein